MTSDSVPRRLRVALLVDQVASEYAEMLIAEMATQAEEQGADLVCLVGGKLAPQDLIAPRHPVFDLASPWSVDAVVVSPLGGLVSAAAAAAFCQRYDPMPVCGIALQWTEHASVLVDSETCMRECILHLVDAHGRRKVAFIGGPAHDSDAQCRQRAYFDVLAARGLPADPSLVMPGNFEYDAGRRAVRSWFGERRTEIDAVVCANDGMAFGAIEELKRLGVPVPERVAVVGFDDLRTSRYVDPALTTVRQPIRDQARHAFRLALSAARASGSGPSHPILPSRLVLRESCGCSAYVHPTSYGTSDVESPRSGADPGSMRDLSAEVARRMRASCVLEVADAEWPDALYGAFLEDLNGSGAAFSDALGRLIDDLVKADGDVGELQRVLTVLVDVSQRHLEGEALRRADAALHVARSKVGAVAGRMPTRRRLEVESATSRLQRTSGDLAGATDLASLRHALAAGLPAAIEAVFVCLYEPAGDPGALAGESSSARMLVAFDRTRPDLTAPEGGLRFPSAQLLPASSWPPDRLARCFVCALTCRDGRSGYVVFEGWTGHGFLYEGLAAQIGSALDRVELLSRLLSEVRNREMAEAKPLTEEMRAAMEIQAGILPRDVRVEGLEVACAMRPATEVAGDYYDIVPAVRGCWIGIGDVSGHGLPAGLATLIIHSVVHGVARQHPEISPAELFALVNAVFFENLRVRMGQSQHATLALLRYRRDGRLACAGAHEVILVCRAEDGRIDVIDPPGTWVGLVPDVRDLGSETQTELRPGDLVVLFTDGVTEAVSAQGDRFGLERLTAEVARLRHEPVRAICDGIVAAVDRWAAVQEDDVSVVVARHLGSDARTDSPPRPVAPD